MKIRRQTLLGLAIALAILTIGTLGASAHANGPSHMTRSFSVVHVAKSGVHDLARFAGIEDDETQVAPGTLDDGKDLLPQAKISIDQAIAAAQTAATGDIGEIDLEHYQGHLVFNVDVGKQDVKVDAATGAVLGSAID